MRKQVEIGTVLHRRFVPTDCPFCLEGHVTSLQRLERAQAALSRARISDEQCETLARNHALMQCRQMLVWLIRDIEPDQPFADVLNTVLSVGIQRLEASMRNFESHALKLVERDLDELLAGFNRGGPRGKPSRSG